MDTIYELAIIFWSTGLILALYLEYWLCKHQYILVYSYDGSHVIIKPQYRSVYDENKTYANILLLIGPIYYVSSILINSVMLFSNAIIPVAFSSGYNCGLLLAIPCIPYLIKLLN